MGLNKTPILFAKHKIYQHLVLVVVNLIFSTVCTDSFVEHFIFLPDKIILNQVVIKRVL